MTVKKIGILGCGMIAELGHMPALRHASGISLHAVYDVRLEPCPGNAGEVSDSACFSNRTGILGIRN